MIFHGILNIYKFLTEISLNVKNLKFSYFFSQEVKVYDDIDTDQPEEGAKGRAKVSTHHQQNNSTLQNYYLYFNRIPIN